MKTQIKAEPIDPRLNFGQPPAITRERVTLTLFSKTKQPMNDCCMYYIMRVNGSLGPGRV